MIMFLQCDIDNEQAQACCASKSIVKTSQDQFGTRPFQYEVYEFGTSPLRYQSCRVRYTAVLLVPLWYITGPSSVPKNNTI